MIIHVIVATVTAIAVGVPLVVALYRAARRVERMRRDRDRALAQAAEWTERIGPALQQIDQQGEVNGVRLKKIDERLRQRDISDADTQPVNHLRVIGGYRSRGA